MSLQSEAVRYLGFGRNKPDDKTLELINICIEETKAAAVPKCIYRRFPVTLSDSDKTEAAGIILPSRSLARNLRECSELFFFAATLGIEIDRLMNRYVNLEISKAAVLQAVTAAYIEEYCNQCQNKIAVTVSKEGLYLRPRFSPGYGDLPLTMQAAFLHVLNAGKTIGINLSDGGVMQPEKSVTAIIGVTAVNDKCPIQGCEMCGKSDCIFRRE